MFDDWGGEGIVVDKKLLLVSFARLAAFLRGQDIEVHGIEVGCAAPEPFVIPA